MNHIGKIEGIATTAFDECSIAAADTARLAAGTVQNVSRWKRRQPQLTVVESEGTVPLRPYRATLVNSQPPYYIDQPESGPPRLLAGIQDDVCLEIASFAVREEGGLCSYVQLGQEMHINDFVVGPKDQRTPVVESIRSMLDPERDSDLTALNEFSNGEKGRYAKQIDGEMPGALARRIFTTFDEAPTQFKERIQLLPAYDAKNIPPAAYLPQEYRAIECVIKGFTDYRTDPEYDAWKEERSYDISPRTMRLFLGQKAGSQALELLAVTRTNVFATLLSVNQTGTDWEFLGDGTDHPSDNDDECYQIPDMKVARDTVVTEVGRAIALRKSRIPAQYRYAKESLARFSDTKHKPREKRLDSKKIKYIELLATHGIHNIPTGEPMPASSSLRRLLEITGLNEHFDNTLGAFHMDTENLIEYLDMFGASNQGSIHGVLPNRRVGATTSDIDITFLHQRLDSPPGHHVVMTGRPSSQTNMQPATFFDFVIPRATAHDHPLEDISELYNTVRQITQ